MKKILSFLLLLALLAGGAIYLHLQGVIQIPQQVLDPAEELFEEKLAPLLENYGLELSDSKDSVSEAAQAYCLEQGGVIETHEGPEGEVVKVCFINDGKDGIRCDAELYYKKECGHGDPSIDQEESDDLEDTPEMKILENSNPESEIAMILSADNGEGATVVREPGTETIAQLYLYSADGRKAVVTPNQQGLAARYEEDNLVLTYENYTATTVDITVTIDGEVTELKNHPHDADMSLVSSFRLIPAAFAEEGFRVNVSLLINSLSCAAGVIGSPTAIVSCPVLAARLVTAGASQVVDIPGCESEEIGECAQRHYREYSSRKKITGSVNNAASNQPLDRASLSLRNHTGAEVGLVSTAADGSYTITVTGGTANYSLRVLAAGFKEETFQVIESGPSIRIADAEGQTVLNQDVGAERNHTVRYDIAMTPDGYIEGEVIDAVSADSIADATLQLSPFGLSDFTDESGEYVFFPSINEDEVGAVLSVSAEGYQNRTLSLTISSELEGNLFKVSEGGSPFNGIIKLEPIVEEDTEEDEETSPTVIDLPQGPQRYSIGFDFPRDGLDYSGTGTLTLNLDPGKTSCSISLTGKASGVPIIPYQYREDIPEGMEIPPLDGNFSGSSQTCSGSIDASGSFKLKGSLNGYVTFTISDTSFEDEDSYPFKISGNASKDGASGTLTIDQLVPIPFQ